MQATTLAVMLLSLSYIAPAAADPALTPENLKDHLWEHGDLNQLADSLPKRKLITRKYSHKKTTITGGLSIGLVKAPINKVLPFARDFANFKEMLPFFLESAVLGSGGNRTLVHVKIEIVRGVVKLWGNLEFLETTAERDVRVIAGRMLKGNMKVFETRFELVPVHDRWTLVLVRLLVDPNLKIAKNSKVNEYNQVNARRFFRAIRDRAEGIKN